MTVFDKNLHRFKIRGQRAITVRHHQRPYTRQDAAVAGHSHKALVNEYLDEVRHEFGFSREFLATMNQAVGARPRLEGSKLRYHGSKSVLNTRVLSYQQTYLGIPVWGAGVNVRMYDQERKVVSASSTVHDDVRLSFLEGKKTVTRGFAEEASGIDMAAKGTPSDAATYERLAESAKECADCAPDLLAGLAKGSQSKLGEIQKYYFVIFEFDEAKRVDDEQARVDSSERAAHPELQLGEVPKNIKNGTHRLCVEVFFELHMPKFGAINWRVVVDAESRSVLYARPAYHALNGLVFPDDPVRQSGDTSLTTASPAADLDAWTTSVELLGLTAADPQDLNGEFIQIVDSHTPTIAPPTKPAGDDFDYSATTDHFAAVNAYYHLDTMYRLVEDFGFDNATYFAGTTFPIPVDHRGRDSTQAAAHYGNDATAETLRFRFGLLNVGDPVGYATDRAPVIHEFAHSCLQNNIADGVFSWCHGFGDALGVVMSDPYSVAPDRFVRSPFMNSGAGLRRHDRDPTAGWAWGGTKDASGALERRQILSTTMFRFYQSTGGDDMHGNLSVRQARRDFAARYSAFLMIGAVGSMSSVTPPANADDFATGLMDLDQTNPDFEGHPGGAFHKVVRWAFEKQGLYKLPGDPADGEGAPPAVDVYIDDGRDGEYEYLQNFWNTTDIWSAQTNDNTVGHQTPIVGETNYLFVRVKNRGQDTAENVVVSAYQCQPGTGLVWPVDWSPMVTATIAAPDLAGGDEMVVGPFEWIPANEGHECILASVTADGDLSNADTVNGDIPHWRLVPFDNNIAQRNVSPELPDPDGLMARMTGREFRVSNPYDKVVKVQLEVTLPPVLARRNWTLKFNSHGGDRFTLAPRANQMVNFSLVPGQAFTRADVAKAGEQIDIYTNVDGHLVGGMSYRIDPNLKAHFPKRPADDCSPEDKCVPEAIRLLECMDLNLRKVESVCVDEIVLRIKLKK